MKRCAIVIGLLVFSMGLFASPGVASTRVKKWTGTRGWGAETPYVRLYNSKSMETISGIVTAIQRFIPGRGMSAGIHLLVRSGVEVIDVHLGPEWFIENQDIGIQPKDQIEIKGSRVTFRGQPVIIAEEILKGEDVLKLRDENGFPAWIAWRHR
jgi:hypothetical protein